MPTINLNLYQLKEVGKDSILLSDHSTEVKVTFANREPDPFYFAITKEEEASFFRGVKCDIGLEAPVVPFKQAKQINIFLDHQVVSFGLLRSVPFPFVVASIEVSRT